MPDSRFAIIISAVDKATAVVRKVNDSFSRLTRPVAEMQKATAAFGKEAGIEKIGKSFTEMGRAAGEAAEKLVGVSTPLAAITSFGSVAGMAALASHWANFGSEIGRTAKTLGLPIDRLQMLRGEAELAGVSSESLTNGLKSLGTIMEDAHFGRNQQALQMFNGLGIAMHKTKNGAVDVERAFKDISAAVRAQGGNTEAQKLIAQTAGMEELLPILRMSVEEQDKYQEAFKKTGAAMTPEQVANADKFRVSLLLLGDAFTGVANRIGDNLAKIQPWIDWTAAAIENHRGLAATIGEVVGGLFAFRGAISVISFLFRPLVSLVTAVAVPGLSLLATGFAEVGAAMLATPLGWIVAGLGAVAALAYTIYSHWDAIIDRVKSLPPALASATGGALGGISGFLGSGSASSPALAGGGAGAPGGAKSPVVAGAPVSTPFGSGGGSLPPAPAFGAQQVMVTVAFENAPRGMRARADSSPGVSSNLRINHAMPSYVTP